MQQVLALQRAVPWRYSGVATAPDWQSLTHPVRPNSLLVGAPAITAAVLDALEPALSRPVFHWPRDGAPWNSAIYPATLVLHELANLEPQDQQSLLAWLGSADRRLHVISLTSAPVYPLVEQGTFSEPLYYRLNCVYVECDLAEM